MHSLTAVQLTVVLTTDDTTPVSTDGEVHVLRAPLDYRICPQALRVIVSSTATRGPTRRPRRGPDRDGEPGQDQGRTDRSESKS